MQLVGMLSGRILGPQISLNVCEVCVNSMYIGTSCTSYGTIRSPYIIYTQTHRSSPPYEIICFSSLPHPLPLPPPFMLQLILDEPDVDAWLLDIDAATLPPVRKPGRSLSFRNLLDLAGIAQGPVKTEVGRRGEGGRDADGSLGVSENLGTAAVDDPSLQGVQEREPEQGDGQLGAPRVPDGAVDGLSLQGSRDGAFGKGPLQGGGQSGTPRLANGPTGSGMGRGEVLVVGKSPLRGSHSAATLGSRKLPGSVADGRMEGLTALATEVPDRGQVPRGGMHMVKSASSPSLSTASGGSIVDAE